MKELLDKIKEMRKDAKGKALLFFGFYFFFFFFLAIFLRGLQSVAPVQEENVKEKKDVISFTKYNGSKYHYDYQIGIDGEKYLFNGLKVDYEEDFNYTHGNDKYHYFRGMFSYFVEDKVTEYKIDTRPREELLIIDSVDILLDNASYESKTEYNSGKLVLRYSISSSTIERIAFNKELDVADEPNEIIITIQDNRITNLEFVLDSYGKTTGKCQNMMRVVCKYSDFDTKEEIVNPIG